MQTPYLFKRIGLFADAGISFLQGIDGKITETGNSTFSNSPTFDYYVNKSYKIKKKATIIGVDIGLGPQFKINKNTSIFLGFYFPVSISSNSIAPEYLNETTFGVNFNF